ncbi:MAG: outer membrane protein assembly factor BamA [Gammaproteobacteria bacterium]|nr:outer membrane protein assembly factor BamA [Gammaproteobacteria bacterium]
MSLLRQLLTGGVLIAALSNSPLQAFEIQEIRVEGLQRIAVGTVYNYLPLQVGDRLDDERSSAAIRALFQTGFFNDVVLEQEGSTLIVFVVERPAIASIEIKGNKDIPSDQLNEQLQRLGFAEGRVFDRALLDRVEQELQRQYLAFGKYNAQVRTTVTPLERNRVAVNIDVSEGEVASIHHLNIIGNRRFSQKELLDTLQLSTHSGMFSSRDQYSRQKLAADLETLRSFYLDRGYINFDIVSTQVTITPDKRHVYITINLHEGEQYRISEIRIQGDTVVPPEALRELISIKSGDIFSRKALTDSSRRISDSIGDVGYAFANINPVPELNDATREVALTFLVDPGKRVYVRRVNLSGNTRTNDEVLRREMRQMEAGWMSTSRVERSKVRLDRLGFFESVSINTPAVPGTPDQVDVSYDVVELPAFGSFNFGIGYGDAQGFLVNASVDWNNFLGSGQRFSINFDNSQVTRTYSFNLVNPYASIDGVSRSIGMFYQETDAARANISRYSTDSYGASLRYGVPVSEYDTVRYGGRYAHTRLHTTDSTADEIKNFCNDVATVDDCRYNTYVLEAGWNRDTRNRVIFPTRGGLLSVNSDVAMPLGEDSLSFYKLRLSKNQYLPLSDNLTFMLEGEAAYANTYGQSNVLSPSERYFAGGISTVRGYRTNSLGPRDTPNDDPMGGNARLTGRAELVFPPPWALDNMSMRFRAFLDVGNVYDTTRDDVDLGELRSSGGLSLSWFTPVGPLTFSYARPLNTRTGDETETFQFTLGTP